MRPADGALAMDAALPVPAPHARPTDRPAQPTLEVEQLCVRFGGLAALTEVGFRLHRGQVVGLIGPNGAGKTTLVNCLSGYQRPSSGAVRLAGADTTGWSPARLRRAGVARTFQAGRLFAGLTVAENVEAGLLGLGLGRREAAVQVRAMLQLLELTADAGRLAGTLPYTAARTVSIARALVQSPAFLLLDEPAAGMSDSESAQLGAFIATLPARFGCGVLLIEHNMALIDRVSERIHVLDGGRSLADGTPAQIRANPAVAAAYLGAAADSGAQPAMEDMPCST
ncbi:MAG TPA: ABC transporter ATP-binding protein [Pseudorhodoferax sp.]|nr:ABC transporter ATP-binding protein [Pseudorhodoferax sp.]